MIVYIPKNLVKQLEAFTMWLSALPVRLVEAVMDPQLAYYDRRIRIQKAKELAELAEVAKIVSHLYLCKGNILVWVNDLQTQRQEGDAEALREIILGVIRGLEQIQEVMSETALSNMQLGAEVAAEIAKARGLYQSLIDLSDTALLEDRQLIDIVANVGYAMEEGQFLLGLIDKHRRELDSTFGHVPADAPHDGRTAQKKKAKSRGHN